jgi:poly(A) polymerase
MKRVAPNLSHEPWLQNPALQKLMQAVRDAGGEARVVGGAVRNALLGLAVADTDIATTLASKKIVRMCKDFGFAAHETGIAHGTVTVVIDHQPFEVTTLRRDVATDGRHATVEFTDDWREDALRRDFAMNALYCDSNGNITDYTNGYADILTQKVRFVGAPAKRIKEDHLRILRFFRFHAHYGRGKLDAEGLLACAKARRNIKKLSTERITQELSKLLAAPKAAAVLQVMAEHEILQCILPHTLDWRVITRLPADPILRLFVLAKTPTDLDAVLRLSNQQKNRLLELSHAAALSPKLAEKERRQILYELGAQVFTDATRIAHAKSRAKLEDLAWLALVDFANHWQPPKFPVSGQDLKSIGIAAGPNMGDILKQLEDWWVASDFTATRDDLLMRATL